MRFKNLTVNPAEEKKILWEIEFIGQTARKVIFVPEFIEFLIVKLHWSKAVSAQCCTCTTSNTNHILTD